MTDAIKTAPTLESLRARRDEILRLAEQYGAYNVRVFGSVARGEATPESDIDFLVDWDYSRIAAWGGVGFEIALEEMLRCKIDVVSAKWVYPPLKERIFQEAVPL